MTEKLSQGVKERKTPPIHASQVVHKEITKTQTSKA